MRKALITGITGQDGSYLAEFLLSKGYEVHGIVRRASTFNTKRIENIYQDPHENERKLLLYYGDLADAGQISNIINKIKPDEIYNLGAQSHVRVSFDTPDYTGDVTGLGSARILESARINDKKMRIYQASSSEMFGGTNPPQNEDTPFNPRSPYAAAKAYAYWMTKNYREGYGLFACNGILFNHESPRRGETFVSKKITKGIARILNGKEEKIYLGNLDAKRDWGFAPEYVEMMWKIMQKDNPEDYVIGTGIAGTVKDFLKRAFDYAGLDWQKHTAEDKKYFRPTETPDLIADCSKAKKELNWEPKIILEDLVKIMVDADMRQEGIIPIGEGDNLLREKFPDKWWKGD